MALGVLLETYVDIQNTSWGQLAHTAVGAWLGISETKAANEPSILGYSLT